MLAQNLLLPRVVDGHTVYDTVRLLPGPAAIVHVHRNRDELLRVHVSGPELAGFTAALEAGTEIAWLISKGVNL
jgi:hypothetical protein